MKSRRVDEKIIHKKGNNSTGEVCMITELLKNEVRKEKGVKIKGNRNVIKVSCNVNMKLRQIMRMCKKNILEKTFKYFVGSSERLNKKNPIMIHWIA